ncbi:MAG: Dienelactone hydrolase [Ferruginibacter sp.]|nr:Dienelactone hydrolase [Ferruginibacter sp.]
MKQILCAAALVAFAACNNADKKLTTGTTSTDTSATVAPKAIKEEAVTYSGDNTTMNGFIAYDSAVSGTRPVVLVVHEWWGLNDYTKSRAKQLAELGYIAMAIDMYGNGAQGNDPAAAGKLAEPFYKNPAMAKARFDAALAKIKTYPQADTSRIAAIGYCFGGAQVLNMARLGENLAGVVSFHGNLAGVPADKNLLKAKILVCHGEADQFVSKEEVANFKKQMDSIGAVYTFKSYPDATHAFTNPEATAKGEQFKMPIKYNPAADSASWNDMKTFFADIFK